MPGQLQGYCVKCRERQEMLSATRTVTKNGRRAMLGTCVVCGTKIVVMGRWDSEAALVGTTVQEGEPPCAA